MYAASAGWYGLASRDRRKRFRLVPIGLTALLAVLLTPLWPYERPDGVALAALIACTVQIVSPWSEQGSRYAKYVRYVQSRTAGSRPPEHDILLSALGTGRELKRERMPL